MVYRGAFLVAPGPQHRAVSCRDAQECTIPHVSRLTEGQQGRVEDFSGEDRLDVELCGCVASTSKVLEEGVPQRLRRRRDVVRGSLRIKLVQAELDDAVDELRVQDGRMERYGRRRDGSVLALDDRLHLV